MKQNLWMLMMVGAMAALAAAQEIDTTGLNGGVACVVPAGDGATALALAQRGGWLVLAVDADAGNVAKLKEKAAAAGLLGRSLYVEQGTVDQLPFADNYVDLLIVEGRGPSRPSAPAATTERGPPAAEILRVLTPIHGRAMVGKETITKPELPGSDWWTHKRHGPNNNPVSTDTVFQFPPILQYRAMPMYTTAQGAGVSGNGIQYEINDWLFHSPTMVNLSGRIFARNAYNGRIRWQAEAPADMTPSTPTAALVEGNLCIADGASGNIVRYDGLTGKKLPPLALAPADRRVRWFAHQDGVLYALIGGGRKGDAYIFRRKWG